MATKSTDQGWPPPPTKSKCLERVSSRYVRRRMAAALLARVGIGSIGCCQKSSSQFRPRLVPRGAGPVLTVRRSLPVYLTNRHARCRSAGLKGANRTLLDAAGTSHLCQQPTSAGGHRAKTRLALLSDPSYSMLWRDLRAMPQEPLSRVERRRERARFSWTSGKRAVASAVAIADSWAYEHGKLNLRRALTAPANASEGADLRATSPARRCLASRLYGIRADDLLRRARIRRRRDDPCRCRRC